MKTLLFRKKMRIVKQYSFLTVFSRMYFNSFLSVGSCPQTLIVQYHNLNWDALSRSKISYTALLTVKLFQNKKN